MRNFPEELMLLEEEHAALKARHLELQKRYDTDVSDLKKRNAELEQTVADLTSNKAKKDAEAWNRRAHEINSIYDPKNLYKNDGSG